MLFKVGMEAQAMSSSLGAMGSLLGKLHAQIVSPQIQLPKSLKQGIEHLTQDLEEINRLLVDLSTVEGPNAMVKSWMNEVRELSYDIEDYIDGTMSSNLVSNHGMNKEILSVVKKFRTLVRQASQRHERYQLGRWASNPSYMVDAQGQVPSSFDAKATDLVGISVLRCELIKWLSNADEAQGRLKVVSIFGPAGAGKSTLAQEVYREIGGQFERRAFVRASRTPDTRRLLRSMISQVRRHQRPSCGLAVQELVDNLRTHLQQKRYFIIIDGLWETISWDIIKKAFPEGTRGSRILITTDIEEVALECCEKSNARVNYWPPESKLDFDSNLDAQVGMFKMEPLSTDDSTELFNRVFGSKSELSEQLKKYAEEIIRKCSGLPLATIIIASVLAGQPYNSDLWHHIKEFLYARNNLSSEDWLREVIGLGYNSLSQQLKTCLLYLSFYPEGYTFLKVDLVKRWTAEGFIAAVEDKHINEVAESNLDVLVSRGFVQPNLNFSDELMFYTVHSTIFEFIKSKSIEENFTTVIDYSETIPKLLSKVRRLSLSFSNAKYATKPDGFTLSPVRSLTFYGFAKCLPAIMEFKLLRVLTLEFWGDQKEFDLSGIFILFHLRYVRITTDIVIKLPVSMQGLKYLETLEIYASLLAVPLDIVRLPKLLHLHLQGDIKLPDNVGQLKSLQTLQSFDLSSNSEDNVKSLGEMANLRDLHITCSTAPSDCLKTNLIALASSIGKHESLKSLTLVPGVSCPSIFTDCSSIVSSPPVFLEKLELLPPICIFSRLPEWMGQLQKLCVLKIFVRELRRDDLNGIAGLQELIVLSLYVRQPIAESIVFNSGSFPFLKYLKLRCSVLRLAFHAEAMPNLRRLKLEINAHSRDQYSGMLVGIEHLLNLQEIAVRIGAAPGTQEFDKMVVESVLKDTISKHFRHLRLNVRRADSIEEEQIPPVPDLATTSSHSDPLLCAPTMVDVTGQSSEIDVVPVPQVSPLNDDNVTSDPDIQINQQNPKLSITAGVLDSLASYVQNMLMEMAKEEVHMLLGVSGEIDNMYMKVRDLKNLLADADRRNITDPSVHAWVRELKDAMNDATDILDLCQLKAMERSPSYNAGCFNPMLFCMQNPLHAHDIGRRIKYLNKRLDDIKARSESFNFMNLGTYEDRGRKMVSSSLGTHETSWGLDETGLVGEMIEEDTQNLVELLTKKDQTHRQYNKIMVFAIVGVGGIGKTTLARKIFKNDIVQQEFSKKIWLSVNQNFNELDILRTAITKAGGDYHVARDTKATLERILTQALMGHKTLIIMDDVWDYRAWEDVLRTPLVNVAAADNGSRVLVTTRHNAVAQGMMAEEPYHRIRKLQPEDAWLLLKKQVVININDEPHIEMLKEIGMEIIENCDYLPLAVKVIGGLLCQKTTRQGDWENVLRNSLWSVSQMPGELNYAIYLSYEDLQPSLKQCFLYYSLLPRNTLFSRQDIIGMWISEGFLHGTSCDLEEKGREYFEELIQRNLIEPDMEYIDQVVCNMHDIVRSFAHYVARDEALVFHDSEIYISDKLKSQKFIRLYMENKGSKTHDFEWGSLQTQKSLRTLISVGHIKIKPGDSLLSFSSLRTLYLESVNFDGLGESLYQLKHLRYLSIQNSDTSMLPENIGKLKFLQYISLSGCKSLVKLPSSIGMLGHLRHLIITGTSINTIPRGFDGLTCLRTLYGFPAHMDGERCSLEELGPLSQLMSLSVRLLENVASASFATHARLGEKHHLRDLLMNCTSRHGNDGLLVNVEGGISEEEQRRIEDVFDELCPPPCIENIEINGYFGQRLPRWMILTAVVALKSLRTLMMEDLAYCTELPSGLSQLPSLELLQIRMAPAIKRVGLEFLQPNNQLGVAFPRLQKVTLKGMIEWEEWAWEEQVKAMPILEWLKLDTCKLSHMPPGLAFHARALKELIIYDVKNLSSLENFTSVVRLDVFSNTDLERIVNLPKLQTLVIVECPKLKVLEGMPALQRLNLEDYDMQTVPRYLQDVSPRHLLLDCSLSLLTSIAAGKSSPEWHKFCYFQQVKAFANDKGCPRKWYVLYTREPFRFETNISRSAIAQARSRRTWFPYNEICPIEEEWLVERRTCADKRLPLCLRLRWHAYDHLIFWLRRACLHCSEAEGVASSSNQWIEEGWQAGTSCRINGLTPLQQQNGTPRV